MIENSTFPDAWMIAAWPGLGNVGVGAASHLVQSLGMTPITDLPCDDFFEVDRVEIHDGIARPAELPTNRFFGWRNPGDGRDLVVFIGGAQPGVGVYSLAQRVVEQAEKFGVSRIITFAAMASQMHPLEPARVHQAVTDPGMISELIALGLPSLTDGQITGLNGVTLAAALDRSIAGACLLAEIPFYAGGVPSPKASHALLGAFESMSDIFVETADLARKGDEIAEGLVHVHEKIMRERDDAGEDAEEFEVSFEPEQNIPPQERGRIEAMFQAAQQDQSVAVQLKHELDRLGVFNEYEDRFLDLFRRAE